MNTKVLAVAFAAVGLTLGAVGCGNKVATPAEAPATVAASAQPTVYGPRSVRFRPIRPQGRRSATIDPAESIGWRTVGYHRPYTARPIQARKRREIGMANQGIRCGRCARRHPTVDDIRACYNGGTDVPVVVPPQGPFGPVIERVTPRQEQFVRDLLDRKVRPEDHNKWIDQLARRNKITVSALIDGLKALPNLHSDGQGGTAAPKGTPRWAEENLTAGFYTNPDARDAQEVYKVVRAVHGSGMLYAKVLDIATGEWKMARGAVRRIQPEWKMTLTNAMQLAKVTGLNPQSQLYGRCWVCGRTLTDEESIANGIGPVCARRHF